MTMKKIELYLYLFLTAAVWVAIILGPLWADTPSIAAKAIALPFLAWIVLSVYYLVRWAAKQQQYRTSTTSSECNTDTLIQRQ